MKRPIVVATILGIVFAATSLAVVVISMMKSASKSCRVCVDYLGRTECREAFGATREEAVSTATDNACSFLAAGMTQDVECTTRTKPLSVTCDGD